jgi:Bacterial protein of unknown function (DUF839)
MRLKRMQSMAGLSLFTVLLGAGVKMAGDDRDGRDFGLNTQHQLKAHSQQLFGVTQPLEESALGPYAGLDNSLAVIVAKGLRVSVVSNATHSQNDMMALWPNDSNPTHIIIAVESGTNTPCVQVVDLNGNPNNNVRTIMQGLIAADPIRRTPWGTILVGEEASDGGLYEILNPLQITTPVLVTNRATGATSDPSRVVKRKTAGSLAFEGIGILPTGTMYYGDELRPGGAPGGAIFKFVPFQPYFPGSGAISSLANSPLAGGTIYGLRVGTRNGNRDFGQGSEVGKGIWRLVETLPDANGNINLRSAQASLGLTGYYRPEDLEVDPIAASKGVVRLCWANTGIMSNGENSVVENGANYGEILSLVDEPAPGAASGAVPLVTRFFAGDPDANHFDNLAFQPNTGYLAVCEDGEVEVVKPNGQTELRGNDIWLLLRDGADRDVQSDGAIKILSLRDTDSETTGITFDASGENAYVHLQHRSTGFGALLKISGFKSKKGDD